MIPNEKIESLTRWQIAKLLMRVLKLEFSKWPFFRRSRSKLVHNLRRLNEIDEAILAILKQIKDGGGFPAREEK